MLRDSNTPQIHFDQMAVINQHHHTVQYDLPATDPEKIQDNKITHNMILQGIGHGQINHKLTRNFLQSQEDWIDWQLLEYKELDSCDSLKNFGIYCCPP